jgi:glycosyltransferase involved in cell wall biosynthesis
MINMRALHFGRFYSENFGGLERHVDLLIRSMAGRATCDNLVANDRFASATLDLGYCRVIKAPSLGLLAGTALCPTMPLIARRLHAADKYDVVHLHFPDPLAHMVWYCMPKGPKLVISWHSDIVRQKALMGFYGPFQKNIIDRADAIVAATPAHFSSSTQLGPTGDRQKFKVVPYGLDFTPYESTPKTLARATLLRQKWDGKVVLFAVSRHVYYKGFEYLIRAMQNVPNSILILGGNGPLFDHHVDLATSLGLGDRVVFPGRIPDEELPAYYHASDIFCMPSCEPSEAFGLAQLEAMACAKPVVCCQLNNGVNYVHQHGITGLAVPPRDPAALAEAINALSRNEALRRKMGAAGRNRALTEFSLEKMSTGMLEVYRSILSGDARSRSREEVSVG